MAKKIVLTALLVAVATAAVSVLTCVWLDYTIEGLE